MRRPTQLAFTFGRFLGQDMALEGLSTLEVTLPGAPKPFGGTFVGLDFWHLFAPKNKKNP